MYYFCHRDISNFNVRRNYYTPELDNQKIHSLKDEDRWWFERINSGKLSFVDEDSLIAKKKYNSGHGRVDSLVIPDLATCRNVWNLLKGCQYDRWEETESGQWEKLPFDS